MKIADFDLAQADRPMIVCEIGASHNGSLETAIMLISAAAEAGADAVKIQAFTPDSITGNFIRPEFVVQDGPWAGRHLYDLYTQAHMPRSWFPTLFQHAACLGIPLFPSVFSIEDIEFVKQFDPPALKISSFELIDPTLIRAAMWSGKPLILSTGMASIGEIGMAASVVQVHPSVWLHCTSSYPTDIRKANLRFMDVLRRQQSYVGLSDHTLGSEVAIMATARGACMIEKHITLTPGGPGLDDGFASGVEEFAMFVNAVKFSALALGSPDQDWRGDAREDREHAPLRRSLYVVEPIAKGEIFNSVNVRSIRPGAGMAPSYYSRVIGAEAAMDIQAGTPLAEHMITEMK